MSLGGGTDGCRLVEDGVVTPVSEATCPLKHGLLALQQSTFPVIQSIHPPKP